MEDCPLSQATANAAKLLREMISIPSYSGEEDAVSDLIAKKLEQEGVDVNRAGNNLWALAYPYNPNTPVLMLNSHMDTVRPSQSYTFDPFDSSSDNCIIRGLGSNDAGASVVSMIETFLYLRKNPLPFNILLAISAEEENSGPNGMKMLYPLLPEIDCAIIGEPTMMEVAIAERGLLVIDAISRGVSGHAARDEGVNAIMIAHEDISGIASYKFDKVSPLMGNVKVSVTKIEAGSEHNVIPDRCSFTMDIRPNDLYTNEEIFDILKNLLKSDLKARSFSNRCSKTPADHELINCATKIGFTTYVSPTTSDWIRVPLPAVKMGPGDSARSHRADEFVKVEEIESGIKGYIHFIQNLNLKK